MKIGYARVSTEEQNLDLQQQALKEAGCAVIFEDRGFSGSSVERPGLSKALKKAREGTDSVLVVWKLDRLGRSLRHLIEVISGLGDAEIGFCSLQEQIDTTSAGGNIYFHMLAALAEFDRERNREQTKAGMAAAKRKGVRIGRPPKLSQEQVAKAKKWVESDGITRKQAANLLGVDVATLRRALSQSGASS